MIGFRNEAETLKGKEVIYKLDNDEYHFVRDFVTYSDLISCTIIFEKNGYLPVVCTDPSAYTDGALLSYLIYSYRSFIDRNNNVILFTNKRTNDGKLTKDKTKLCVATKVIETARAIIETKIYWDFEALLNDIIEYIHNDNDKFTAYFSTMDTVFIAELLYYIYSKHMLTLAMYDSNMTTQYLNIRERVGERARAFINNTWYDVVIKVPAYNAGHAEVLLLISGKPMRHAIVSWNSMQFSSKISKAKSKCLSFDHVDIVYKQFDNMNFGEHITGWSAFYNGVCLGSARTKKECTQIARVTYNNLFK